MEREDSNFRCVIGPSKILASRFWSCECQLHLFRYFTKPPLSNFHTASTQSAKMPRRRFIDPKNATTFNVVHRAQNDPLINDDDAPSHVFAEKQSQSRRPTESDYAYSSYSGSQSNVGYRSKKTKQRGDLEDEFGLAVRKNEGEAAEHGIFYDDSEYDYMQHMRDLGSGGGAVTWVDASAPPKKQKGKQKLEDALRGLDLDDGRSVGESVGTQSSAARSLLPEEVLPSEFARKRTYQDQQDVPDEIAGFQPDMDPRLREVLEALEDEEYVDEEDDIFGELTRDGYEVEIGEWERLGEQQMFDDGQGSLDFDGEDDDGWESDDTIKASSPPPPAPVDLQLPEGDLTKPPEDVQAVPPADPTSGAWLDEFKKFKSDAKASKEATKEAPAIRAPAAPSALESSALSSLATGRRKKRKGAKTATTNYSMTSSALARTDQQTLLDSRFDKIEEEYAADGLGEEGMDDSMSAASGMTGASQASHMSKYSNTSGLSGVSGISSYSRATDSEAPQLQRSDFDSIMDDFLGGYSKTGKMGKRVRRGAPQTGMEQLDEVRKGLGPARVKSKAQA